MSGSPPDDPAEPAGTGSPTGRWSFSAVLWRWRDGAWRFVTLPEDVSDDIEAAVGGATGGFGSVRVEVTVGASVWRTSLFPSSEAGAYVLPVKKAVRAAEGLADDDEAEVTVRLVER